MQLAEVPFAQAMEQVRRSEAGAAQSPIVAPAAREESVGVPTAVKPEPLRKPAGARTSAAA
jgi:hypothetical protein